jgi:outer membrane lipase/esterase
MVAITAAQKAEAGSWYVFGDSLSDNGNIMRLTGVTYPAAPYYGSRFSNGPVWAEYFPSLAGLNFKASNDYAVGGAFTGPISLGGLTFNNLINTETTAFPTLPSIQTEIASFAAAGGHFGAGDVVGLWGGANNYFAAASLVQANPTQATAIVTTQVGTAISQLGADAQALIGLGARTLIVPNLPPLGLTPSYNTSAQGIALGNAFSSAHDTYLPQEMALLHAQTGANIIVLNEAQLFSQVVANPSAYGFSNVTQACINVTSCVTGTTAQQNTYLFWDTVHPTTAAHLIIAEYAADAYHNFQSLTVPAEIAVSGAENFATLLDNRMDALRWGASGFSMAMPSTAGGGVAPNPGNPLSAFITGSYGTGTRNTTASGSGYSYDDGTIAGGVDYRFSPVFTGGIAFGYGINNASINGGGSAEDDSYQMGVYGVAAGDHLFLKFQGTLARDTYSLKTPGVIGGNITASPDGETYRIGLETGYVFHGLHQIDWGPVAGVRYTNVDVHHYTQAGDAVLTESVGSQTYQRAIVDGGLQGATTVTLGSLVLKPYASAKVEARIGSTGSFTSVFTDEPLVPLTSTYQHEPSFWGLFGVGVTGQVNNQIAVSANFTGTAFKSNGNDFTFGANVSYRF